MTLNPDGCRSPGTTRGHRRRRKRRELSSKSTARASSSWPSATKQAVIDAGEAVLGDRLRVRFPPMTLRPHREPGQTTRFVRPEGIIWEATETTTGLAGGADPEYRRTRSGSRAGAVTGTLTPRCWHICANKNPRRADRATSSTATACSNGSRSRRATATCSVSSGHCPSHSALTPVTRLGARRLRGATGEDACSVRLLACIGRSWTEPMGRKRPRQRHARPVAQGCRGCSGLRPAL